MSHNFQIYNIAGRKKHVWFDGLITGDKHHKKNYFRVNSISGVNGHDIVKVF